MIDFTKILETNRVLLRPLSSNDFERFTELCASPELWACFTSDLSDKNTLKKWIDSGVQEIQHKRRLAFSIIDKQTKLLAGSTSLGNISESDKRIEIGWTWLGKSFQGKGINDQAKYLLLKYCFEDLDCKRVEFKTDVLNTTARNALKRIGAVEEGVLRSHTLMVNQRRRDTIYYSILSSEWQDVKRINNWL